MIEYAVKYHDKLFTAIWEHIEIVMVTMVLSLLLAAALTIAAMSSGIIAKILIHTCSVIYSIPSLALFALLIPVTGLGKGTAVIVLVIYNQYILLRNFVSGLKETDPSVVEAARGMGMTNSQILLQVRLPLSVKAVLTGVRLAVVSTIGIATIAAFINAGGLGTVLYDGLRTMNVNKIVWGSLLAAGLALSVNFGLNKLERRLLKNTAAWRKS